MGAKYSMPAQLPSKHFHDLLPKLSDMSGKVVAVTGCTSGTGYICAKVCAERGARVVMLNRPSDRADEALRSLREAVPAADVTLVACDLTSFEEVRRAGKQLREELAGDGLDVLCNNAGVMGVKDQATVDGCDVQMQTNHLSHFLLTGELMPLLERAAELRGESRVVNHSSGARKRPARRIEARYLDTNGGDLGGDADDAWLPFQGGRWSRYQQSKLANVVFTYALHDRLQRQGSKVKALVAHPGLSATNLQVTSASDGGMGQTFTNLLMKYAAHSGEDGTCGLLRCCCDPEAKSGEFYGPPGLTGPAVLNADEPLADAESRDLLWEQSLKTTGASFTF